MVKIAEGLNTRKMKNDAGIRAVRDEVFAGRENRQKYKDSETGIKRREK